MNPGMKRSSPFGDEEDGSSDGTATPGVPVTTGGGPDHSDHDSMSKKRKLLESHAYLYAASGSSPTHSPSTSTTPIPPSQSIPTSIAPTPVERRPWKDVYSERATIERNWRRGRHQVTTLKGHTDGVMCLQLNENLIHPNFPVLISGSYDRTVRVWNMETGQEVGCLRGHTRAVRALQFDEVKLITASMDRTLRVWNWRTGACIRVLEGHNEGVVCLAFDKDAVLASGSVDTTVKVWNLRKGDCFTLRGHEDWVNAVTLWDGRSGEASHHDTPATPSAAYGDLGSVEEIGSGSNSGSASPSHGSGAVDADMVGKMLFSASDDCTIRLWDLGSRTCVREFKGHVGQIQSIKLMYSDGRDKRARRAVSPAPFTAPAAGLEATLVPAAAAVGAAVPVSSSASSSAPAESQPATQQTPEEAASASTTTSNDEPRAMLISGGLDNMLKLWDVETGEELQTYFGHIEGVWAVVADKLRFVSASHDRTIKVRGTLSILRYDISTLEIED